MKDILKKEEKGKHFTHLFPLIYGEKFTNDDHIPGTESDAGPEMGQVMSLQWAE